MSYIYMINEYKITLTQIRFIDMLLEIGPHGMDLLFVDVRLTFDIIMFLFIEEYITCVNKYLRKRIY